MQKPTHFIKISFHSDLGHSHGKKEEKSEKGCVHINMSMNININMSPCICVQWWWAPHN